MAFHATGQPSSFRGQTNDERTTVTRSNLAGNQATLRQTVENTGESGPFMRQTAVQVRHASGRRIGEKRENVRLTLGQSRLTQLIEVKTDPVRGPVNRMNKT